MENKIIASDYNTDTSDRYNAQSSAMNVKSISDLQKAMLPLLHHCKTAVDFGCGAGDELLFLKEHSVEVSGVDCSPEMIALAKEKVEADLRVEDFTATSFEDGLFDLIISKWAFQSNETIGPIYAECTRLLKKNGYLVFLTKHPLRQFLEKKKQGKDYFKKETVHSNIFNKTITVHEPSHTLSEYISDFFLENFSLISFSEGYEFPGAEQINGDIYPTYLVVVAQKK